MKKVVKLTEKELHSLISESVIRIMNESMAECGTNECGTNECGAACNDLNEEVDEGGLGMIRQVAFHCGFRVGVCLNRSVNTAEAEMQLAFLHAICKGRFASYFSRGISEGETRVASKAVFCDLVAIILPF